MPGVSAPNEAGAPSESASVAGVVADTVVVLLVDPSGTVIATGAEAADALPVSSAWVAVSAAEPRGRAGDGVHDQVPSLPTVAVQTTALPFETVTVSPATPVPEMSGVVLVSVAPPAGDVIVGACGSTSPTTVWVNSLPLLVRLSATSISHVPAIGFATWKVAVCTGVPLTVWVVNRTPFTVRVLGGLPVVVVWVATEVPAGLTRYSVIG